MFVNINVLVIWAYEITISQISLKGRLQKHKLCKIFGTAGDLNTSFPKHSKTRLKYIVNFMDGLSLDHDLKPRLFKIDFYPAVVAWFVKAAFFPTPDQNPP